MNIFKVNGKVKILTLIGLTLLPLLGGLAIGYLTRNAAAVYMQLEKPIFAPPSWVYIIVWPIIYILMGLASYRIYMIRDQGKDVGTALFFYLIQLLLNFLWPIIFFSFRLYGLAFIELIILFIFIIITFVKFIKLDKIAGFLLIPYIIWTIFAGVLNFFLWMKNEM
ncbi:TspO/MBR family protein [Clostridium paraputrificum]|uniref:TspO/MBR family protein n=1 Tax=Clostridium paraputrificum TaxID=29363 RepID=UPI003D352D78